MIRTILVDDEPRALSLLQTMLSQRCPDVQIVAQCRSADEAEAQLTASQPDLLFLDISMPGRSGMELLAGLTAIIPHIIFVTAYDKYSIEAFRYSAVDYLLKPVDEAALEEAVARARKRIEAGQIGSQLQTLMHNMSRARPAAELKICLPSLKGFQVVEVGNIVCCEAGGSYTVFYLADGRNVTVSKPLHDYEQWLEGAQFVRVHKSYLVNLRHVAEYQRGEGGVVILSTGREIEVARRRKEEFLEKMGALVRF